MKLKVILSVLAAVILTGCAANQSTPDSTFPTNVIPTQAESVPADTEPAPDIESIPPYETSPIFESVPAPILDKTLKITPGHHMLSFTDPETHTKMKYWLFVPDHPTEDMPLIVYLHGMGQIDKIHELERVGPIPSIDSIYANDFPFLLLYPNTPVRSWTADPIPDTLKSLIDHVVDTHYVDSDRIIITGHSMGAVGTWHMLSQYGNFFSAAVPISCPNDGTLNYDNLAEVPIRAFVGNGGEIERTYGKGMDRIVYNTNLSGGDALLTILYQCDHTNTPIATYTKEMFEWMLEQ